MDNVDPAFKVSSKLQEKGDRSNNKMERINGEIRDCKKTMRGLKKSDARVLTGYQLHHNYIRPHMSLEGKTPSELAEVKIEGCNKWLTLIQNSALHSSHNKMERGGEMA